MIDKIQAWILAKDWRTWLAHGVIGALIAFFFNKETAIVVYAWNEWNDIRGRVGNPLDYLLDFLSPTSAALAVEYILWPWIRS